MQKEFVVLWKRGKKVIRMTVGFLEKLEAISGKEKIVTYCI
jgi:hypothetical protein